jgi:hypothetical protein
MKLKVSFNLCKDNLYFSPKMKNQPILLKIVDWIIFLVIKSGK